MPFNFLNGDGEYQVKFRPLKQGDIFRLLGTPKDRRYLVLTEPQEHVERRQWFLVGGKDDIKRYYTLDAYSFFHNLRQEGFQIDTETCYELVAELDP